MTDQKLTRERAIISMAVMAMQANDRFDEETAERLLQVFDAGYSALETKLEAMKQLQANVLFLLRGRNEIETARAIRMLKRAVAAKEKQEEHG